MVIVASVLVVGALVGAAGFAAARRWPATAGAPRLATSTVEEEVAKHPGLGELAARRLDPSTLTGLALTVAGALIVVGAVGVGVLLAMVRTNTGLAHWDLTFARFGARHASPATTTFLRDVSLLASTKVVLLLAVVVGIVEYRRFGKLAVVGFLALAAIGQFLVADLIKLLVHRARPDVLQLTGFSGTSFPSGHSTAAAAAFAAFALLLARGRSPRIRAALVGMAAGLAGMVATSRVLLGVHWFTDVLAGLLLGWAWFAVCSIAFGGRVLRFGTPGAQAALADAEVETGEERLVG